ncbi:STAS domain-containing protein [Natroniella sulfidigena]|uniref:STAS domain-containing protein n=1 Tax=Natroniella sulfidigena TaxID=723921 RepID=UPI00200A948D|nr:STAS domain-containing protein [Natroniella sulfidigena]MCK8816826.1 STAS domain-containing protein [Natroniella sulfidigena]
MFELPTNLTIYNVEQIQEELITYFETKVEAEQGQLILEAAEVEDIDAAGLQLLVSAYKTANKNDLVLQINNLSNELKKLLTLAGAEFIITEEKGVNVQ